MGYWCFDERREVIMMTGEKDMRRESFGVLYIAYCT
jgi:hypothetical protein